MIRWGWVIIVVIVLVAIALSTGGGGSGSGSGPEREENYIDDYGGAAQVYADIAAERDCVALQLTFDRAALNNDGAEAGSAEALWTTGYMTAANDRMETLGCYE